ncbi:HpaII family restriction endonuclease [Empedobacter brevis]|uniref:HpaII family restriction endonuclease n=1 Tax=Empedobacter brevis TaxID=247 RepID=UPI00333F1628
MITGNKGEWSEPYVLLKLLADKKLFLGKEKFQKVENIFYPILQIISSQKENDISFTYEGNLIIINSNKRIEISIEKFLHFSKRCFQEIKSAKSKKGSFSLPEIEAFLNEFGITKIKEKSKVKNDITIQIQDPKTFLSPTLGFSIKSQLGRPSTLVNASSHTNFTYCISKKLSQSQIQEINSCKEFSQKFKKLNSFETEIIFDKVDSSVFNINLQTIDSSFPSVISDLLLKYYCNDENSKNSIVELSKLITEENKLNFDLDINPEIYEMMIKRFLLEYALGMRASEVWKRDYEASGGYLVVRDDGEILCYHFYFIKNFEDYLFQNTKLDTPSSSRYKMAEIYEDIDKQKFKLNLQVRFIK